MHERNWGGGEEGGGDRVGVGHTRSSELYSLATRGLRREGVVSILNQKNNYKMVI